MLYKTSDLDRLSEAGVVQLTLLRWMLVEWDFFDENPVEFCELQIKAQVVEQLYLQDTDIVCFRLTVEGEAGSSFWFFHRLGRHFAIGTDDQAEAEILTLKFAQVPLGKPLDIKSYRESKRRLSSGIEWAV